MVHKIIAQGKKILIGQQTSVLSAATLIMVMIIASRLSGLVRQRVLDHFFHPEDLALFFAAFRLPDTVFEVLVFGTFSSAFIPVFTKALNKGEKHAWDIASTIVNLGLIVFLIFAVVIGFFAYDLYSILAPGFTNIQTKHIADLARILFAAQGFFIISYVLTGVLESQKRFLIPALAPLFYNLGIIIGTIIFAGKFGLYAPVLGVVIGALSHFLIQLPLAHKLGFRFKFNIDITDEVKKIGKLALPRVIEVSFTQIEEMAELFFASLIATAAYTYYTLGNTLQLLPVGLFGTSIAKAALPTLTNQSDKPEEFARTLLEALAQLIFLTLPVAVILIVLRIPAVRLVYGSSIFDWEATNQTGYVLSVFAVSIVFQSANALLARGFYALHDTRTPVTNSIIAIIIIVILDALFIEVFHLPVWGLALAFTLGNSFQFIRLFYLINKRILKKPINEILSPILRITFAGGLSGIIMWFSLKIFDRYVWLKRLYFLGGVDDLNSIPFQKFVLDTRYTINVIILSLLVSLLGLTVYCLILYLMKSPELATFISLIKRLFRRKSLTSVISSKEEETIIPPPGDPSI
jgi:putative peptidoglycan lipid II flippase